MSRLELKENLRKYTDIDSCPVRNVLSRFSGKWSVLILCVLSENKDTRFNTIAKAIPDISPKVLSDTLKALEMDGLIRRRQYSEIPPKVEYSLTELGHSLLPILEERILRRLLKAERRGDDLCLAVPAVIDCARSEHRCHSEDRP